MMSFPRSLLQGFLQLWCNEKRVVEDMQGQIFFIGTTYFPILVTIKTPMSNLRNIYFLVVMPRIFLIVCLFICFARKISWGLIE